MSDILAECRAHEKAWRENWQERLDDNGELYGDLQCPYCGDVIDDLTDYGDLMDDQGGDVDCPSCGKTFTTDLYFSYHWASTRKNED